MAAKFEGAHSIGNREFPETAVSFMIVATPAGWQN